VSGEEYRAFDVVWAHVARQCNERGLGNGATCDVSASHLDRARRGFCALWQLAGEHDVPCDIDSLMLSMQAKQSTLRDSYIEYWQHDGAHWRQHMLIGIRLVMKACCSWETVSTNGQRVCPGFVALDAALERVKPQLRKKLKKKQFWAAMKPHVDIFTQGGDVVLPAQLLLPDEPTWLQRQAVYQKLLPEVEGQLEALSASGGHIAVGRHVDQMLTFRCLFLISESVPPQRKAPWQHLTFVKAPPCPVKAGTDEVDPDLLDESPAYLFYRESVGVYGITQLRTKVGTAPWLPLPQGIQRLVELYLELIGAGYAARGRPSDVLALWPSQHGTQKTPRGDSGFNTFEKRGWKDIGLPGATVMNSRHALVAHLIQLGITPSSNDQGAMADSMCAAMNTSTKQMFGEKRHRDWGIGAYNLHCSAGGHRRAQAAVALYAQWVFAAGPGQKRPADAADPSAADPSPAKKRK